MSKATDEGMAPLPAIQMPDAALLLETAVRRLGLIGTPAISNLSDELAVENWLRKEVYVKYRIRPSVTALTEWFANVLNFPPCESHSTFPTVSRSHQVSFAPQSNHCEAPSSAESIPIDGRCGRPTVTVIKSNQSPTALAFENRELPLCKCICKCHQLPPEQLCRVQHLPAFKVIQVLKIEVQNSLEDKWVVDESPSYEISRPRRPAAETKQHPADQSSWDTTTQANQRPIHDTLPPSRVIPPQKGIGDDNPQAASPIASSSGVCESLYMDHSGTRECVSQVNGLDDEVPSSAAVLASCSSADDQSNAINKPISYELSQRSAKLHVTTDSMVFMSKSDLMRKIEDKKKPEKMRRAKAAAKRGGTGAQVTGTDIVNTIANTSNKTSATPSAKFINEVMHSMPPPQKRRPSRDTALAESSLSALDRGESTTTGAPGNGPNEVASVIISGVRRRRPVEDTSLASSEEQAGRQVPQRPISGIVQAGSGFRLRLRDGPQRSDDGIAAEETGTLLSAIDGTPSAGAAMPISADNIGRPSDECGSVEATKKATKTKKKPKKTSAGGSLERATAPVHGPESQQPPTTGSVTIKKVPARVMLDWGFHVTGTLSMLTKNTTYRVDTVRGRVGFDCEWPGFHNTGFTDPERFYCFGVLPSERSCEVPSLIQIATLDHIGLIRLYRRTKPRQRADHSIEEEPDYGGNLIHCSAQFENRLRIPEKYILDIRRCPLLRDFLCNPQVEKIGDGLANDILGLNKVFKMEPSGMVDVRNHTNSRSIAEMLWPYFGIAQDKKSSKAKTIRLSAWDNPELSDQQQCYAAVDAFEALITALEHDRRATDPGHSDEAARSMASESMGQQIEAMNDKQRRQRLETYRSLCVKNKPFSSAVGAPTAMEEMEGRTQCQLDSAMDEEDFDKVVIEPFCRKAEEIWQAYRDYGIPPAASEMLLPALEGMSHVLPVRTHLQEAGVSPVRPEMKGALSEVPTVQLLDLTPDWRFEGVEGPRSPNEFHEAADPIVEKNELVTKECDEEIVAVGGWDNIPDHARDENKSAIAICQQDASVKPEVHVKSDLNFIETNGGSSWPRGGAEVHPDDPQYDTTGAWDDEVWAAAEPAIDVDEGVNRFGCLESAQAKRLGADAKAEDEWEWGTDGEGHRQVPRPKGWKDQSGIASRSLSPHRSPDEESFAVGYKGRGSQCYRSRTPIYSAADREQGRSPAARKPENDGQRRSRCHDISSAVRGDRPEHLKGYRHHNRKVERHARGRFTDERLSTSLSSSRSATSYDSNGGDQRRCRHTRRHSRGSGSSAGSRRYSSANHLRKISDADPDEIHRADSQPNTHGERNARNEHEVAGSPGHRDVCGPIDEPNDETRGPQTERIMSVAQSIVDIPRQHSLRPREPFGPRRPWRSPDYDPRSARSGFYTGARRNAGGYSDTYSASQHYGIPAPGLQLHASSCYEQASTEGWNRIRCKGDHDLSWPSCREVDRDNQDASTGSPKSNIVPKHSVVTLPGISPHACEDGKFQAGCQSEKPVVSLSLATQPLRATHCSTSHMSGGDASSMVAQELPIPRESPRSREADRERVWSTDSRVQNTVHAGGVRSNPCRRGRTSRRASNDATACRPPVPDARSTNKHDSDDDLETDSAACPIFVPKIATTPKANSASPPGQQVSTIAMPGPAAVIGNTATARPCSAATIAEGRATLDPASSFCLSPLPQHQPRPSTLRANDTFMSLDNRALNSTTGRGAAAGKAEYSRQYAERSQYLDRVLLEAANSQLQSISSCNEAENVARGTSVGAETSSDPRWEMTTAVISGRKPENELEPEATVMAAARGDYTIAMKAREPAELQVASEAQSLMKSNSESVPTGEEDTTNLRSTAHCARSVSGDEEEQQGPVFIEGIKKKLEAATSQSYWQDGTPCDPCNHPATRRQPGITGSVQMSSPGRNKQRMRLEEIEASGGSARGFACEEKVGPFANVAAEARVGSLGIEVQSALWPGRPPENPMKATGEAAAVMGSKDSLEITSDATVHDRPWAGASKSKVDDADAFGPQQQATSSLRSMVTGRSPDFPFAYRHEDVRDLSKQTDDGFERADEQQEQHTNLKSQYTSTFNESRRNYSPCFSPNHGKRRLPALDPRQFEGFSPSNTRCGNRGGTSRGSSDRGRNRRFPRRA